MPALTMDQVLMLDSYKVYTTEPKRTLFTLERLSKEFFQEEFGDLMQGITNASSKVAAVSHFTKRYGQFIAMQFYMFTAYDEIWDGDFNDLQFDATEEFGQYTVCMFANPNDWRYVNDDDRVAEMHAILQKQCHEIVLAMRYTSAISPKIIWENIFVHITNIYAKLVQDVQLADKVMRDLELLEDAPVWQGIAQRSLYYDYTQGRSPSELVNKPIRKSCCLSKDVPGLAECGYCPLG
ncbi:Fe-S oxidoreductase [Kurthia sibirica]|uniref:Fe-S oxidoreductase n=1 Tax=Kurthia sibirica TaxID=202750 RepID=A0A2U3AP44_9BACL|nr:Fe-S oxidoreductase [Kurthia sibirica]PWI26307.1 Fe-S oxidoreductase [Kurthia sibirica]GEK35024.1 hypothetical protein KSI01_25570 [Kurthia sibirica]